jgi:hypothetical protein
LHADHRCRQVGLLRIKDSELIDLAGVQLLLNHVEACLRGLFRMSSCPHGTRIRLQSTQGVGNILECGDDDGAILGFGLIQSRFSGFLFVIEREAVEDRCGCTRRQRIKSGSGREGLREVVSARSAVGREQILGSRAAIVTPTCALVACMRASAALTSGR